jgi:taurine dioxygenase
MSDRPLHEGKLDRAQAISNARLEASYEAIYVTPVTPVIGVSVKGVDLTKDVSDAQIDDLTQALANHNVLFFRDQPELTPQQQIAFARRFGTLHIHPAAPGGAEHPELFVIHTHGESFVNNGADWHTDVSCDEEPPLGTMLQIHRTPGSGGDTLFANMYAAYDALSDKMKGFLEGKTAVHDSERAYRGRYADKGVDDKDAIFPINEHPVVRTHPVSGRQALYVNETFTSRIRSMTEEESEAILEFLFRHMARPEFQVRFHWEPNSIAFWDNRSTQHLAMWDYWPNERYGHRVTVKGDRPFYRAN